MNALRKIFKRPASILFVTALFCSFSFNPQVSFAQTPGAPATPVTQPAAPAIPSTLNPATTGTQTASEGSGVLETAGFVLCNAGPAGLLIQASGVACQDGLAAKAIDAVGGIGSAASTIYKCADNIGGCIMSAVGTAILAIATLLLGIAGVLFNLVVIKTVFGFSTLMGNSPGLLIAWGILRDIGNILILFGFIFIGVATILNLQTYSAKKSLAGLLVFAVLMNFSLFAAEAIIDTSNVLASVLYSQANNNPCLGQQVGGTIQATGAAAGENPGAYGAAVANLTDPGSCLLNYGLAGAIMDSTGLSTMFAVRELKATEVAVYVGLALFATIGAVVLFAASFMLITRAIILIFLMITSPIGFAGMAVPPLQPYAKQWWSKLLHQAFFAPVLILLILVSLKVTEAFSREGENGLAAALTQPNTSVMGIVLVFVLIIGFLIGSLIAARKFGMAGADFAVSTAMKVARSPLTLGRASAKGTGGFIGRNTVGRGGAATREKYDAWMGRRGSTKGSRAARTILRNIGVDKGIVKATDKATSAKFGGSKSFTEKKKDTKARDKELKTAALEAETKTQTKEIEEKLKRGEDLSDEEKRVLARLSTEQLESLNGIKNSVDNLTNKLVQNLSPEQFDKLMNSKELPPEQKDKLRNARFDGLGAIIQNAEAAETAYAADKTNPVLRVARDKAAKEAKTAIKQVVEKDLGHLARSTKHSNMLNNETFASLLSDDQFKSAQKNKDLTVEQRGLLEDRRNDVIKNPARAAERIPGMNSEDIGKMPGEVFDGSDIALDVMNGRQLAAINIEKLSPSQYSTVVNFVKRVTAAGTPAGNEFTALFLANPKVKERWEGVV